MQKIEKSECDPLSWYGPFKLIVWVGIFLYKIPWQRCNKIFFSKTLFNEYNNNAMLSILLYMHLTCMNLLNIRIISSAFFTFYCFVYRIYVTFLIKFLGFPFQENSISPIIIIRIHQKNFRNLKLGSFFLINCDLSCLRVRRDKFFYRTSKVK